MGSSDLAAEPPRLVLSHSRRRLDNGVPPLLPLPRTGAAPDAGAPLGRCPVRLEPRPGTSPWSRPTAGAAVVGGPPDRARQRQLTEARSATWLVEGSSSVRQQALREFDRAMQSWWKGSHRRPTGQALGNNDGFCVRDVVVRKLNPRSATGAVPKLGLVRFKLSRPLPDKVGIARVTVDAARRCTSASPLPQRQLSARQTGTPWSASTVVL